MRLRTLYTTLLLCLLTTALQAEKYNVLHVRGTITMASSKQALKPGDVIDSEEKVSFSNKEALAALFSPSKGRFTLSPGDKTPGFGEEFFAYVKSNLLPAKKGLSTRAGGTIQNLVDFQNYFGRDKFLLLDRSVVEVSEEAFPMEEGAIFFYVRFRDGSGETLNRKLSFRDDQLVLDPYELLELDGKMLDPSGLSDYRIFYYHAEAETSKEMCAFHPVFADGDALASEVAPLVTALRKAEKSPEEIRNELYDYMSEYHGQPDRDALKSWYSTFLKD